MSDGTRELDVLEIELGRAFEDSIRGRSRVSLDLGGAGMTQSRHTLS
jgi:hypothetical protein